MPHAWLSRAQAGSWAAFASMLLVAAVSPFERPLPLAAGGFTVTTTELAVTVALIIGGMAWLAEPGVGVAGHDPVPVPWARPLIWPGLVLLMVALAAAAFAPEFRGNALRTWGRLLAAAGVAVLTARVITTPQRAGRLIATLLAAGALVGLLAVLELMQVPWVMDALRAFRPGFHVVGGQVRATATLIYPTIASMYLEVVFALGLFWMTPHVASGFRRAMLGFAALTLVGAGIIATFTRAGLITMALSLALVGALTFMTERRWSPVHGRLALLASVLVVLVLASRSPQMLVTRMSTEGSQDWYGAAYSVPSTLTLRPGSFNDIPVTLSNSGWITWQSDQLPVFALSYHWLTSDTEEVVIFDGLRTPFARPVAPGDRTRVRARVRAPGYPGTYVLVWDVVQEHRTWLSIEGVDPGRTVVKVEGEALTPPLGTHGRLPSSVMRLPRRLLWNTALAVARDHPWLGIGPDNFRQVYGRYLSLASWDTRVHANNTYLEVLAGTGVVGLAVVAWLMVVVARTTWTRWRALPAGNLPLFAVAVAATAAIAAHGVVDSFLTFTPTYVVFAIALGVLFSPAIGSVSSAALADGSASSVSSAAPADGSASSVSSTSALRAAADRSAALTDGSASSASSAALADGSASSASSAALTDGSASSASSAALMESSVYADRV